MGSIYEFRVRHVQLVAIVLKSLLCSIVFCSCSIFRNPSYETVRVGADTIIQSPVIRYKYKSYGKKAKNRYCYVLLYGITSNYNEAKDNLNEYEAWCGDIDYFVNDVSKRKLLKKRNPVKAGHLTGGVNPIRTGPGAYQSATLHNQNTLYFVQLDYSVLISGDRVSNFQQLARDLLIETFGKEGSGGFNWPRSISQNITSKILEAVPCPSRAVLSPFVYTVSPEESFVLVGPHVALRVDHQSLYSVTPASTIPRKWNYHLEYQSVINFFRGNDGALKQTPFLEIEKNTSRSLPDNNPLEAQAFPHADPSKQSLLTSSADLQLSANTNTQTFVGLYQNFMKRNVHSSWEGVSDATYNKDDDLFIGNSMLLLNTNLATLISNFSDPSHVRATFGSGQPLQHQYSRILMTPVIYVQVNGNFLPVALGSTIGILDQQYHLGSGMQVSRLSRGQYYPLNGWNSNTILLPGDKIVN